MRVARWLVIKGIAAAVLVAVLALGVLTHPSLAVTEDEHVALSLASMLRAARTVISEKQGLINDPEVGDKGLTGDAVVAQAIENYKAATGTDPRELEPESRHGRLIEAQLAAVKEVMDENQDLINAKGTGFKGFVPAVFARLVNERFAEKVGEEARIKVTAPPELVRNRKARPDEWEAAQIKEQLQAADWPEGQIVSAKTEINGRDAFRVLVPEYYTEGCLSCHGGPAGELDVTGYPKEGGALGDLGGAISITLYQ
jgi:hypothetical protein